MDLEKEKTGAPCDDADSQFTIHDSQSGNEGDAVDGDADSQFTIHNAQSEDEGDASCDDANSQCTIHNAQLGDEGGASCDDANDGESEDEGESESESEGEPPPAKKAGVKLIVPEHTRRLPLSVIAALLGVVLGSIPVVLLTYITNITFYPLFIIAPLLIHLLNSVFKGCRDIRAFVVNAVFSLAGMYTTAVACQAALYTSLLGISISWIPRLTAMAFGQPKVLPSSASAYMYLFIFTVLGICIAWELLRAGMAAQCAVDSEPGDGGEPGDDGEACDVAGDEDEINSQCTVHDAQLGDEDEADSQCTVHDAQSGDTNGEDDAEDADDETCDAQPEVVEDPGCETSDAETGNENGADRAPVE